MPSRQPKQLLLAFLGEYVVDAHTVPIRATAILAVLEGAGIAVPAARATLDRLVQSSFLTRERRGREILFSLTQHGAAVLREATDRVRGLHPFEPNGKGWTLVTFSIPEDQRRLRHQLRSTLTWEGFAPIRDGLWLAPGEVDLDASLAPLREDLPSGTIAAFRASELPGFSIAESVRSAWDISAIRAQHESFIDTWASDTDMLSDAGSTDDQAALTRRVILVADWLALLRADPRLPEEFLDAHWPAAQSFALYRRWRDELDAAASAGFAALVAPREKARAR